MTIAMGILANILSAAAVGLLMWRRTRAWAPLFGLATQAPWWYYAATGADTRPLLIACVLYTTVYAHGSYVCVRDMLALRRMRRLRREWKAAVEAARQRGRR